MGDHTEFGPIRVTAGGVVGRIEIHRPGRRNALDEAALRGLIEAAGWFDGLPDVKVVVVRGSGRVFSAGADAGMLADLHTDAVTVADADLGREMADAVEGISAVTVAAIEGYAIGGGAVLAAACDLRLMAADAWVSIPEIDIGIPLAWGGIPRLVRLVGMGPATDLILTGRRVGADEARAIGFVTRVVESADVDAALDDLVRLVASKPRAALLADKAELRATGEAQLVAANRTQDAEMMLTVLADAESAAAGRRYLERFAT